MNGAVDEQRLPASIGGLVDLAFAGVGQRAPLYLVLSLAVFAAGTIVEFALPAAKLDTPQADGKLFALQCASLFADAFVIAAVAIGIGTRVAGEAAAPRAVVGAAAARWLAVIGVNLMLQIVVYPTLPFSGFGPLPDPAALAIFTAPLIWIVWTVLSLAAPIAALSSDRNSTAIFTSVARAIGLSVRRENLARLCILTFISTVPNLLQDIAYEQLVAHHVARAIYWSTVPIDACTVVIVAAMQTVFALDFARRAGALEPPRR